jgi:hypothetical protein
LAPQNKPGVPISPELVHVGRPSETKVEIEQSLNGRGVRSTDLDAEAIRPLSKDVTGARRVYAARFQDKLLEIRRSVMSREILLEGSRP